MAVVGGRRSKRGGRGDACLDDVVYRCLPRGICSWNSRVSLEDVMVGETEMGLFGESGVVCAGSDRYEVRKGRMFSGEWLMVDGGGKVAARAEKHGAMACTFSVVDAVGGGVLETNPRGFNQGYELIYEGEAAGLVKHDHGMTRRCWVRVCPEVPIELWLFGYWLIVMGRRRESEAGAG